ncbi:MAG: transglycosylase domain-containing protein, partial [Pseudomonadales bacterium]|nr:transglycosylase domain-containing protein [Pseudomonadales bacterium]
MKSSRKTQRGFFVTLLLLLLMLGMLCAIGVGIYALSLDGTVRQKFEGKRWAIPAKVYSRPLELYSGAPISKADVLAELALLHYRRQDNYEAAGVYTEKNGELYVHTRGFVFSDETERAQVLKLKFNGNSLVDIASTEPNSNSIVRLEPLVIGGIYPKQNEDRVLMQLKEAPKYLEQALLSTEDKDFYHHFGVSIRGTLRAIFVNLSSGELRQGGSTLTQQLVKNFYLTD